MASMEQVTTYVAHVQKRALLVMALQQAVLVVTKTVL